MRQDWPVETFVDVLSQAPSELRPWLLDFEWSREKLWSLPIEESEMSTQQLAWLLELPWWRGTGGQVFTVRPIDVTAGPRYQRTTQADLSRDIPELNVVSAPLDRGWLIADRLCCD
jgi:hypothetical protein